MAGLDKWLYNFAKARKTDRLKLTGYSRTISATTVTSLLEDGNGHMLMCSGTSVPSALDYFAKGCLFIKTDAAALAKAIYENVGTSDSCSFNLLGEVSPSDIPLTPAYILVGNASSVAASVALTGDMGISNTGVMTVSSQMTSKIESQVDANVSVADSKATSETSRVNSVQTSEITDRGIDESNISSKATSETSRVDSVITSEITDRGADESLIDSKATSETSRVDSVITSEITDRGADESLIDSKATSETSRVNSVITSEITDRGADESNIDSRATSETSRVDSVIASEITDRGADESLIDSRATSETSRVDSAITSSLQDYETMSLSNLSYLSSKMVSAGFVT